MIKKRRKNQAKKNLMSTLDTRDELDRISEACSMIVYFYIWNLTWINIWRIKETTKYCEKLGDLLLLLLLFIYWRSVGSSAALRWFCTQIWIFTVLFHTGYSQFVLMYFCVYIYIYIYAYIYIYIRIYIYIYIYIYIFYLFFVCHIY